MKVITTPETIGWLRYFLLQLLETSRAPAQLCGKWGSRSRPRDYETHALPAALLPLLWVRIPHQSSWAACQPASVFRKMTSWGGMTVPWLSKKCHSHPTSRTLSTNVPAPFLEHGPAGSGLRGEGLFREFCTIGPSNLPTWRARRNTASTNDGMAPWASALDRSATLSLPSLCHW